MSEEKKLTKGQIKYRRLKEKRDLDAKEKASQNLSEDVLLTWLEKKAITTKGAERHKFRAAIRVVRKRIDDSSRKKEIDIHETRSDS